MMIPISTPHTAAECDRKLNYLHKVLKHRKYSQNLNQINLVFHLSQLSPFYKTINLSNTPWKPHFIHLLPLDYYHSICQLSTINTRFFLTWGRMCHWRTYRERRRRGNNIISFSKKTSYKKDINFSLIYYPRFRNTRMCEMFNEFFKRGGQILFPLLLHLFKIVTKFSLQQ